MRTFQQSFTLLILLVHVAFAGAAVKRTCVEQVKYTVDKYILWLFYHKTITKTKNSRFCCAGYLSVFSRQHQNIDVTSDADCKPYCQPSCTAHSTCQPPTTCECVGSSKDSARPTTKRRCECNEGFVRTERDECIPVCPEHCLNGSCSGHTCICNGGYKKNDLQMCVLQCPGGCGEYEECTCPGVCSSKACGNPGFERDEMAKCVPKCTNGSQNGQCIAPEECTCNEGYAMNEGTKICEAKCGNCTNGVCVLPGECNCSAGFEDVEGVCVEREVVDSEEMSMAPDWADTVWLLVGTALGLAVVATVAGVGCYARKRTLEAGKSSIEAPIALQHVPRPMLPIPEAAEVQEEEFEVENDLYGKF